MAYARVLAHLLIRVIHLVPRPVLIALAKAALERAEAFLEARATTDARRKSEVQIFAGTYQILDSLA